MTRRAVVRNSNSVCLWPLLPKVDPDVFHLCPASTSLLHVVLDTHSSLNFSAQALSICAAI